MNDALCRYVGYCEQHKNRVSASTAVLGLSALAVVGFMPESWRIIPFLYALAIIVPIIIGMAGKVEFRWVVLWESIMLFPVAIVALIAAAAFLVKK